MDALSITTLFFSIITPFLLIIISNQFDKKIKEYKLKDEEISQVERTIQASEETLSLIEDLIDLIFKLYEIVNSETDINDTKLLVSNYLKLWNKVNFQTVKLEVIISKTFNLDEDEKEIINEFNDVIKDLMVQSLFLPSNIDVIEKNLEVYKSLFDKIMKNIDKISSFQTMIRQIILYGILL